MPRFQDRVVIVTGAAMGIGRGCAEVFCREGGKVAILDLNVERGQATAAELTAAGPGEARFWQCDVCQLEALQQTVHDVAAAWGRLDCLINNAGTHPPATSLEDTSLAEMEQLMRLNYLSTFSATQAAIPHLRQTRGTIVNISSMTAILGQDLAAPYCATKAAQVGLTKGLAIELGRDGIRVNAILPSNIETPLMHVWAKTVANPEAAIQHMASLQVFNRLGRPDEIGSIALFLATDDSSFMTGQAVEAEGGSSLDY